MGDPTLPSPPHPPRWSKTAAIVVTVVFTLVVVVALFGLWAFAERRDADAERQNTSAMDSAGLVLDQVYDATREALSEALREAAGARDAESLRRVVQANPPLVRRLCRHDGREYFWCDGQSLLYTPEALRADWANAALEDAERASEEARLLGAEWKGPDSRERLEGWTELVLDYVMVAKPFKSEKFAYPIALDYVKAMLGVAARVPLVTAKDHSALRNALLAALTAEGLNRTRTDLESTDRDVLLKQIRTAFTAVRARLPVDVEPFARWEVDRFEALRDVLANPEERGPIENAIRAAKVSGTRPGQVQLHYAPPHTVAIVADTETSILTALQLDRDALRAFVAAEINNPRWATPGFSLGLSTDGMSGQPIMEKPLADVQTQWNLHFSVVVSEAPTSLFGTATDWFYWTIIALACVGIGIGGWVLVRLLTRQVRLAELKADFVSNLSHELKTPITSIGLFAEMLRDGKLEAPDERAEAYSVISQESDRLKHTVARMLGVAQRAASRSPYRMQPGDLNVPIQRAVERFRRLVIDPGLDLEVELAPAPLPMTLDVAAIEDVATNLLTNAWKYRQGDRVCIRVRTLRRRGKAVLEVADDGVGIPRRERRRVFQMFYRSNQYLSQGVSGTGLGLALVRTVVRGHHGRIRVLDGPNGRGTTFEATFPFAPHDSDVTDGTSTPQSDGQTRVPNDSADRRSKQPSEHRRTSGPAAEHS